MSAISAMRNSKGTVPINSLQKEILELSGNPRRLNGLFENLALTNASEQPPSFPDGLSDHEIKNTGDNISTILEV